MNTYLHLHVYDEFKQWCYNEDVDKYSLFEDINDFSNAYKTIIYNH
jgi:hypothetical protein